MINGYLITMSLSKKFMPENGVHGGGNFELKGRSAKFKVCAKEYFEFEISRVVRLLPLLLVAGLVCMNIGFFVMLPDDYENLSQSVIATNFFGNNILASITTKDYWNVANEYKPLMHTWYVGVIMQFYLIYPLFFLIARKRNKSKRLLVVSLAVFSIASFVFYFTTTDTAFRFYHITSRFFEFAVGGIVALVGLRWYFVNRYSKVAALVTYALLLLLLFLNTDVLASKTKLILVVMLTSLLLILRENLNNRIASNVLFAKVGAASYSIFVWHQVVLAFCRYSISSHFTAVSYLAYIIIVALVSLLSYRFIEQSISTWLKGDSSKKNLYSMMTIAFVGLTAFSLYVYQQAGVVRDVPELDIKKGAVHRGLHSEYCDKIYNFDKPFETQKRHWLVIGDSYGRDFANTVIESSIADSVEISYIYNDNYKESKYEERFAQADLIFMSSRGINQNKISEMEDICNARGFDTRKLVIVGLKNFGECNGQIFIKRGRPDYFKLRTRMADEYYERNATLKANNGERYLDLIEKFMDVDGNVPVFTPDHHFISQDCLHLTRAGAIWLSQLIDWSKYLE